MCTALPLCAHVISPESLWTQGHPATLTETYTNGNIDTARVDGYGSVCRARFVVAWDTTAASWEVVACARGLLVATPRPLSIRPHNSNNGDRLMARTPCCNTSTSIAVPSSPPSACSSTLTETAASGSVLADTAFSASWLRRCGSRPCARRRNEIQSLALCTDSTRPSAPPDRLGACRHRYLATSRALLLHAAVSAASSAMRQGTRSVSLAMYAPYASCG